MRDRRSARVRARARGGLVLLGAALAVSACSAGHASPARRGRRAAGAAPATSAPATSAPATSAPAPSGRTSAGSPASPSSAAQGTVRMVTIPGGDTGFLPRQAAVYLPPAAAHPAGRTFPVMELLHGTPGGPTDWVTRGELAATMNAFAAAHAGVAPIVVAPDENGARQGDTECIRTPYGASVERYLTVTVPQYVLAHYPAATDPQQWLIGGVSEGGTCAAMIALRSGQYRSFADLSGMTRPTVGERDDPELTIRELFGGSRTAYEAHDTLALLRAHRYPSLSAWFACGSHEGVVQTDQAVMAAAARSAGIRVHAHVVAGGHFWTLWRVLFQQLMPWAWSVLTHRG